MKRILFLFDFKIEAIRQAWRCAASAGIAYIISTMVFHFKSPEWLIFTAVVCVQANLGATIRKVKQRFLGTVFGCGLGFVVNYFFHDEIFLLLFLFALSLVLIIENYMRMAPYFYTIFFLTFALFLFYVLINNQGSYFAMMRMQEVAIGALLGMCVSFFFWPETAKVRFKSDIGVVCEKTVLLFDAILLWTKGQATLWSVNSKKIDSAQANQAARDRLIEMAHEFRISKFTVRKRETIVFSIERIHYALLTIFNVLRLKKIKDENFQLDVFLQKCEQTKLLFQEMGAFIPHSYSEQKRLVQNPKFQVFITQLNAFILASQDSANQETDADCIRLYEYLDRIHTELQRLCAKMVHIRP